MSADAHATRVAGRVEPTNEWPDPPPTPERPGGESLPADILAMQAAEAAEAKKADALPTVRDVGNVLPIGFVENGTRHREFTLNPWTWQTEEEVSALIEKEGGKMTWGTLMSEIVSRSLRTLGTLDVAGMKRSQRRLLVHRMYHADVMYVWLMTRIEALGHECRLEDFRCPKCGKDVKDYVGDLRSVEVKVLEEIPSKVIEVEGGFKFHGERRDKVKVGPVRWSFMETDDAGLFQNQVRLRLAILQHSFIEVPGAPPGIFDEAVLKSMSLRAVRRLVGDIDTLSGGPRFVIEGTCSSCKTNYAQDVDWKYESFFGPSSV